VKKKPFTLCMVHRWYWMKIIHNKQIGWSEPIATNAPVEDEAVQAILGMNQKHILLCPKFLVFSTSSMPHSFSLLPTSFLFTSPLLPTSPHFAFIPLLELGSTWSGTHEFHRQNLGVLEMGVRIMSLKRDPWQHVCNKTQDNALEVGAIIDRLELELEDKFPPLSPFIFGYVTTKKATTAVVVTFFYLRKRRWWQQWTIIFFCGSIAAKRQWWQWTVIFFYGFIIMKKATTPSCCWCCREEEEDDNFRHFLRWLCCKKWWQ